MIQAVEHFTEEVRILLEMLHGKAKDEAWNNQVKEKLSPALQEEVFFKDAAWPSPFVPGLEYNSPDHGISYIWECFYQVPIRFMYVVQTVTEV